MLFTKPMPKTQPVLTQNINPVKNNDHSRNAQPVGMKGVADIAVEQINNRLPQSAAGAPFKAHQF